MNSSSKKTAGETPRFDHSALCLLSDERLEEVFRQGTCPDSDSLAGWEFNGFNTGTLAFAIRKFRKGFFSDPESVEGEIGGYNVNISQNGLLNPWIAPLKKGSPVRHSYYRVYPTRSEEVDNLYPNGVLLNYSCDRTPFWNPASLLRDYLVQVYPDNPDLLLGKAYAALPGGKRLFVSFFVLERSNRG